MHEHLERALRHFSEDLTSLALLIAQGQGPIPMKRRGHGLRLGSLTRVGSELILTADGTRTAYFTPFHVVNDGWVAD